MLCASVVPELVGEVPPDHERAVAVVQDVLQRLLQARGLGLGLGLGLELELGLG